MNRATIGRDLEGFAHDAQTSRPKGGKPKAAPPLRRLVAVPRTTVTGLRHMASRFRMRVSAAGISASLRGACRSLGRQSLRCSLRPLVNSRWRLSNPHSPAAADSRPSDSRFPSLEAFGRRPKSRAKASVREGPASETLHTSGPTQTTFSTSLVDASRYTERRAIRQH